MGVEDTQPEAPETPAPEPQGEEAQSWFDGFDDVTKGTVQNKGWKGPEDAVKSYIELQKHLGVPKERLLTLPESLEGEEMGAVFNRLGRPENPEGYELDIPEDGKELVEAYAKIAHDLGLSKAQAKALFDWETDQAKTIAEAERQQAELARQSEEKGLKDEWGANYDKNLSLARHGAKELGVDADLITAIETQVGYKKTMEMFAKAGERFGEHQFHGGDPTGPGQYTPEGAKAEFERLSHDKAFMEKLNNGDAEAKKRINDLIRMGAVS